MFRPLRPAQRAIDIAAAALFFVAATVLSLVPAGLTAAVESRAQIVVALVLTAVFSTALAVRRLAPGIALAGAWAGALLQMAFALPPLPMNLAILGILYAAAAYGTRRVYWASFASAIVGAVVITGYLVIPPLVGGGWSFAGAVESYLLVAVTLFFSAALGLLLSWTIGALVRTGIRAREHRVAQEQAEADAVAEQERTRIARDMHDVVAHSLSVVIAQADGARYAAADDPAVAAAALDTISTTARAALSDVRLLLTQLRHRQGDGPQPTLADLEGVYAQVRGAGVDLRVDVDPAPRSEPPAAVQLAVYRILQEALTNALRHGAGGPVTVALAWHPARVEVRVRNPLAPTVALRSGAAPRGHGLIGMRERAQLVGGALEAGEHDGAFVVTAILPIGGAE